MGKQENQEAGQQLLEWINGRDDMSVVALSLILGINNSRLYKIWNAGRMVPEVKVLVYIATGLDKFEPDEGEEEDLYFEIDENLEDTHPALFQFLENGVVPISVKKKKVTRNSKSKKTEYEEALADWEEVQTQTEEASADSEVSEDPKKKAGRILKEWIEEQGYTVPEFAKFLGINDSTFYKVWNHGKLSTKTKVLVFIATGLDVFEPETEAEEKQYKLYSENLESLIPTLFKFLEQRNSPSNLEVRSEESQEVVKTTRPDEIPQRSTDTSQCEEDTAEQVVQAVETDDRAALREVFDISRHMLGQAYSPLLKTLRDSFDQNAELSAEQLKLGELHIYKAMEFLQGLLGNPESRDFVRRNSEFIDHLGALCTLVKDDNPEDQIKFYERVMGTGGKK